MYGGEHMPRSSPRSVIAPEMEYPDSDGQPMAERFSAQTAHLPGGGAFRLTLRTGMTCMSPGTS